MDWKDAKSELLKDRKLWFLYYLGKPKYWLESLWLKINQRKQ